MSERPSVLNRVTEFDSPADAIACYWLGEACIFVLAEDQLLVRNGTGQRLIPVHEGGILESAANGERIVTCGDDGQIVAFDGETVMPLASVKGWADHVALGPDDSIAYSSGRSAYVKSAKGETKELKLATSAGGLAFFPKGMRLAIAHYNGVSLWFPNTKAAPDFLEWKGSHLGVSVSPDARFIVTTMQEPQLHGWRLSDGRNMRMSGYPGKIRSFSWTDGGKWLATAGANCAVIWPFSGKDGPMGQQPQLLAPGLEETTKVTVVAAHPSSNVVATGYDDGMILLVRLDDGAEILLRKPDGKPVIALGWRDDGQGLGFGIEGGRVGLADL